MRSMQELWQKALRTMNKDGDFKAAVLSLEDGLPLVSAPAHYEDETAAAMVTLLNETAKRINHQLQLPQVDEISIVYDDRTRLVCRYFTVDGHALLLMVLAPPDQSYRRLTNRTIKEIGRVWLSRRTVGNSII
jgi:predicted regulator of Ras-like GTPase activity (Roadblock/LC7/MglB family)